jgi:hypothetical protein
MPGKAATPTASRKPVGASKAHGQTMSYICRASYWFIQQALCGAMGMPAPCLETQPTPSSDPAAGACSGCPQIVTFVGGRFKRPLLWGCQGWSPLQSSTKRTTGYQVYPAPLVLCALTLPCGGCVNRHCHLHQSWQGRQHLPKNLLQQSTLLLQCFCCLG